MALPTLAVEFAPTNTPLATAPTWVDITAYVLDFETSRGFGNELDTVADAGTVSIALDNRDRRFDPTYAAGPYFGNLVDGKQVRIRATYNAVTYDVFKGHIEGYPQTYPGGMFNTECVLTAVDGTQYLANAVLENDAVLSSAGKAIFHRRKRKLGGFHEWMTRGPEGAAHTVETSEYSDLIQYSKPWAYWPVSGDGWDDTVQDVVGDKHLIPKNGATVNQLGTGEQVFGDEYPPSSMNFTAGTSDYFQTAGLEVPQFKSLTVECMAEFSTLPSVFGTAMRLVSGPMDSGNVGPIFTLYVDTNDDINARVRLTDNTNYTWIVGSSMPINTTFYAALIYDAAAGTIGGHFDSAGGSGATGAGALKLDDPGTNRNVFIGGHPNAAAPQYLNGQVQHVAIYNRVLSTATLNARYTALTRGFVTGQTATTRIGLILNEVGWPFTWRDLNTGTSQTLIGRRYSNQSGMDEINTTEAANFGRFWIAPDGNATTYERDWRNHADFSSSAATIGDDPTENRYTDIGVLEPASDATKISRVLCKSAADEEVQMNEDAAITPPVTLDLGEVILDTAASASSLASALVTRYKTPQPRFKEITIEPEVDPTNLWPKVLGYDLCKQVTIKRRPKGSADTAISQASHIERISHRCTVSTGNWVTTWTVSPR